MNEKLPFDFIANKEKNNLTVRREFAAHRQMVWDCYTKSELLDQWFAPKPFTTKTKSMDFKVGGHWHYAMIDPDGKEYWGWTEYTKIQPINFYETWDAFCDSDGNLNIDLPKADWHVHFSEKGENAVVETIVTYSSLADLESVLQMGMKEGLMSTLERLDDLLLVLNK